MFGYAMLKSLIPIRKEPVIEQRRKIPLWTDLMSANDQFAIEQAAILAWSGDHEGAQKWRDLYSISGGDDGGLAAHGHV